MSVFEQYKESFVNTLQLDSDVDLESLAYRDHGWDSVAHMVLMASLEEAFDVMLDTDDIIDFSSFEKGKEILRKYDVEL
jgi:acyl carrier protein